MCDGDKIEIDFQYEGQKNTFFTVITPPAAPPHLFIDAVTIRTQLDASSLHWKKNHRKI